MFELSNIVKINLWTIVFELTSFVQNSENYCWNLAQQFELTNIVEITTAPVDRYCQITLSSRVS